MLRIGLFPKREERRLRIFRFKELRSLAVAKGASRSPSNRGARRDVQEGTKGAREAGSADGLALGRRRRRRRARLAGRTAKERQLVGGTRQGHPARLPMFFKVTRLTAGDCHHDFRLGLFGRVNEYNGDITSVVIGTVSDLATNRPFAAHELAHFTRRCGKIATNEKLIDDNKLDIAGLLA